MEIIPVIDLKGGQVVHAQGGRRDDYRPIRTPLSATSEPGAVVAGLLGLFPFRQLYIADLDAIERRGDNEAAIAAVSRAAPELELWVDNGADDPDAARAWLESGRACLVIGSESQRSPALLRALSRHPRVILSLDFRGEAFQGPAELLADAGLWPERVIAMTLARVGAQAGPDVARVRELAARRVYAAGGVRNAEDLRALAEAGAAGALVATALHGGALSREVLEKAGALPRPAIPPAEDGRRNLGQVSPQTPPTAERPLHPDT